MEVRDNKYYTNNFLKPNKTIIPYLGMCHRQQRWNTSLHLPRLHNIHDSIVASPVCPLSVCLAQIREIPPAWLSWFLMVNSYHLPAWWSVQQIVAAEFYPEISSNLTGSCQLETLISLTFKPLRKKLTKFCKQFIKINFPTFYSHNGLTYFANQFRL